MDVPSAIEFDPMKDTENVAKHGVSFAARSEFVFETAMVSVDDRRDYGERREVAIGFIRRRLHVLVFTVRDGGMRAISLRKASVPCMHVKCSHISTHTCPQKSMKRNCAFGRAFQKKKNLNDVGIAMIKGIHI